MREEKRKKTSTMKITLLIQTCLYSVFSFPLSIGESHECELWMCSCIFSFFLLIFVFIYNIDKYVIFLFAFASSSSSIRKRLVNSLAYTFDWIIIFLKWPLFSVFSSLVVEKILFSLSLSNSISIFLKMCENWCRFDVFSSCQVLYCAVWWRLLSPTTSKALCVQLSKTVYKLLASIRHNSFIAPFSLSLLLNISEHVVFCHTMYVRPVWIRIPCHYLYTYLYEFYSDKIKTNAMREKFNSMVPCNSIWWWWLSACTFFE